ncbi:helix-turn-helix domain-containing protein [Reichenbachiella ulvae]|uniref:Helix-turn-helix domain-containing protein n=1 Tax=Reichenbachiella ulvae TaxID=2980104 RepID=A0ABT3CVA4_9BACT|nr:helix-turn-helix domain-containing protein [Reichenbachiella ulvae]MCV9387635.1 helix-turn-helix domain-containing protein [Reichenbachiella ulvae]
MTNSFEKSIAVLPFVNMSADGANEFFCDGITEEIITALAQIDQLKVTSRTSSFYFKGKQIPISQIGEQLQVGNILEGSVRVAGDRLRITAQLIHVADDSQFWTESWDRKLENIFDIQDEISLLIADKLREHFGHLEIEDQLAERPTQNLNAYEHLLKGKKLFNKWNPEDVNLAIGHFEEALRSDPQMIDAHTGLADAYSFLAVAGFAPREEAWTKSISSIQQAESIDPDNAPLNYLLANQAFFTEANYEKALQYAQKAIASKPNYSEAQQFMSFLYMMRSDGKKAEEHLLYAKSIDPLNEETKFFEAYYYYRMEEYEKSNALLKELLTINPRNLPALLVKAYILILQDESEQFEQLLDSVPTEMIMPDERLGLKCLNLLKHRTREEFTTTLAELEKQSQSNTSFQAHAYLYMVYSTLERYEDAFAVLENLFDNQSSILLLAFADPLAGSIHEHPKFEGYKERIFKIPQTPIINKKANSSALDEATSKAVMQVLEAFVSQDCPYLNPSLSLRSLAEQIEIHPNQLSWLLNEKLNKNFNEYINERRIEHFKKLVVDPTNSHISLIGLAYESGFSSKTVFNTAFKRFTGMTPKAYQKSHQS